MKIRIINNIYTDENTYIVYDENGIGIVIDPGNSEDSIIEECDKLGINIDKILITHCHYDHVEFLEKLREKTKAQLVCGRNCDRNLKNKNVNLKDIVVLYRANYLTRELETTLSSYRIKYKVFGGQKFFQRKEIKDVLAYFRLLINDLDDTAFDRVINVPKRGMGPTTLERIVQASEEMGKTFSGLKENISDVLGIS